jgi:sarcosine dehydrogenase
MGFVRHPGGVTEDFVLSGSYELEVASERVPAQVTLEPLYDPKNLRVKA